MKDIFPFDYQGGGYFRRKGVPVGSPAPILHGNEAVRYVINALVPPVPDCIKKLNALLTRGTR